MKPLDAKLPKDIVEIEILRSRLRDGGICPVRAALGPPDPESPLCEIEAVAAETSDSICLLPDDQRGINTSLQHEVLDQLTDLVVGKSGKYRRLQAKALAQAPDDIVLSAALPGAKLPGRADPAFSRIQTKHYLSQRHRVKGRVFS